MTYKNNSFLFSGDIYKQRESELVLNKERNIDSDVLKVPHHGYDTSSSTVFIKAVSPKYAVVEAYEIRSNVIMRYLQEKAKHYVTAINGNILITSDGNNLSVAEEKKTGRN